MLSALAFSFVFHWSLDLIVRLVSPTTATKTSKDKETETLPNGNDFAWRNPVISLFHAVVSGIWALLAFYLNPELYINLIDSHSGFDLALVAYSTGYFLMDSMHMYYFSPARATYELIIHHIIIVVCFSSALLSGKFIGYAVVALLAEVNSIFLHLRRISKYLRIPVDSSFSHVTCLANIGTFIVFRFLVLSWMMRWLVVNRDKIAFGYYCLGSSGLAVIILMNIVLFMRIVNADFRSHCPGPVAMIASATLPSKHRGKMPTYATLSGVSNPEHLIPSSMD